MNYKKHYNQLIFKGQNRILEGYSEIHHIIPKCIGGNNDKLNLVNLTPEEHYVAHQLLVKIYPNERKLIYALHMMTKSVSVNKGQRNNKIYGWVRRKFSKIASENMTRMRKDGTIKTYNKGISNPKQRERMLKNNPMKNPEISNKVRLSNLGRTHSNGKKGYISHNKIYAIYKWNCETCGDEHESPDTAHMRGKRFCNRSCQAIWSNRNRAGNYKHKPGLKRNRNK